MQRNGLSLPTAARIVDVREDNYRTRTIVLDCRLDAAPGQFVMLWLPRFDEKPYSLVSANPVTLMVTAVGPFSRLLHERRPGDRLWLRGPFGRGFTTSYATKRAVLVGGGYGVAPLYWLAQSLSGIAQEVQIIVGARTAEDVLYAGAFHRLDAPGTRYVTQVTTEDGSLGRAGRVTDALDALLDEKSVDGLYACGPHGMLSAVRATAIQHDLPAQLSWEAYMRCGIGVCGACEHEGKVLCMEGPVLHTEAPSR